MRQLATVREIKNIESIPNADNIVVATVDGWKVVVRKGEYEIGEKVIYCEIDSFLPIKPEYEFLRASSYRNMDGKEGFRIKTIKLRKQISQGLILKNSINASLGDDVTEQLGIIKYEPPIPAELRGQIEGMFPSICPKTDEERIQNLDRNLELWNNKIFHVSEKLDGTSATYLWWRDKEHNPSFHVCSRNLSLRRSDTNTYWKIAAKYELEQKLQGTTLSIQGEIIGPGIQKNKYSLLDHELYVFNVFDYHTGKYLSKNDVIYLCKSFNLKYVPIINTEYKLPNNVQEILDYAEGKSILYNTEREGLVFVNDDQERISFKAISNKFLLKDD